MTKRKNAWKDQGKNIASRKKCHEQCGEWDWEGCEIVAGWILYSQPCGTVHTWRRTLLDLWTVMGRGCLQWEWLASEKHHAGCDPGCGNERAPQIKCKHWICLNLRLCFFTAAITGLNTFWCVHTFF